MNHKFDSIIAFIGGDLLVTFLSLGSFSIFDETVHFIVRTVTALVLGMAGGLGGLLIKDIYNYYKTRKK